MKNTKLFYLLFAASILAGCGSHDDEKEKENAEQAKPKPIETFALKKEQLSTSIQLPGELIAYRQVDLYAKVSSYVKELHVDIGSEVKSGQLLVTLEAPELMSQLAAAESRLKSQEAIYEASNATYNRLVETSKVPGTISQNDLDQANAKKKSDFAQFQAMQAAYKEITAMRDYLEIRAPFDGVVSSRNVNLGAYVGPAGKGSELPILTVQEQKLLRLAVSVPEACTGYLQNGHEVNFTVKAFPGHIYAAMVRRMSGALDQRLRSERVEMDVDNENKKLLPGMVAEVTVPLPANDSTFIVPSTAVINSAEGIFVIKVVDNKAEKTPVKKGRETPNKIEVFGNLKAGERLVTKASEEMRNGTPIK